MSALVICPGFNDTGKLVHLLMPHSMMVHSYISRAFLGFSLMFLKLVSCDVLVVITVKPRLLPEIGKKWIGKKVWSFPSIWQPVY